MVDTGATCSILPFSMSTRASGPHLTAADGRRIDTLGQLWREVQFGDRNFWFKFLLAAVEQPILGNGFLAFFKLLVDPALQLVLEAASLKLLVKPPRPLRHSWLVAALNETSDVVCNL